MSIKLKCHYCGATVYRKRRIVAPACDGCKVQQQQETERQRENRRKRLAEDAEYKEKIEAWRKRYFKAHDYADRSRTSRPRRIWEEGEKEVIASGVFSTDELAKRYKVSTAAIRAQRWKMKNRQVILRREAQIKRDGK